MGGAFAAVPLATIFGLTETHVKDDVGIIPATLSLEPGFSSLETGLLGGTIYDRDLTRQGLGMKIQLNGPPANLGKIHSLASPEFKRVAKVYTSMFQHPDDIRAGYSHAIENALTSNVLRFELEAGGALAIIAFLVSGLSREGGWKRMTAGTVGALMLLSAGFSIHRYAQWQQANQIPQPTYRIDLLAGTPLENVVVDNKTTAALIDGVIPLARQEIQREKRLNQEFITTAHHTIDNQIAAGAVAMPDSGETACLLLSDVHANADMINVYRYLVKKINQTYGQGTLDTAFFDGDQTYGSAAAKAAVDSMGDIARYEYAVIGNHDSQQTIEQMNNAGMDILNGPAVDTDSGLSAVGVTDPQLTKQGVLFVADNIQRPGFADESEADAGRILQKRMQQSHPTIALAHEAYVFAPILGKDNISKDTMAAWFAHKQNLPDSDAGSAPDHIPNIAASAVAYGHWHRRFMYRVVSNDDGTWTVVMELGTAGGASSVLSLSHFSTPQTIPGKRASAAIMIVNNKSNLVTSVQEIATHRNGEVTAGPVHHIGSANGQPYPARPGSP